HQHVPRSCHMEMITLGLRQTAQFAWYPRRNFQNIFARFCSTLVLAGIAVSGWGASPETAQRFTSVVRPDTRSGKLVRSMVVTSRPVTGQRVIPVVVQAQPVESVSPATDASRAVVPSNIEETVDRIAAEHSLPPQLIHSVIKVESNYNPYAVSSKGALGIM